MVTVTKLARLCHLGRSSVLYYESVGLLKPALRSGANYRVYGENEIRVLQQIRSYRAVGLSVKEIRSILSAPESKVASALKRRLLEVDKEIETLRGHQKAILKLLQTKVALRRTQKMTKDKWVSVMKAAGFSDHDMHRWHREFEHSAPEEHEEFLQFLHLPPQEIQTIRDWSRKRA
jgi:DNA-binding transcriptional MerR regulator